MSNVQLIVASGRHRSPVVHLGQSILDFGCKDFRLERKQGTRAIIDLFSSQSKILNSVRTGLLRVYFEADTIFQVVSPFFCILIASSAYANKYLNRIN